VLPLWVSTLGPLGQSHRQHVGIHPTGADSAMRSLPLLSSRRRPSGDCPRDLGKVLVMGSIVGARTSPNTCSVKGWAGPLLTTRTPPRKVSACTSRRSLFAPISASPTSASTTFPNQPNSSSWQGQTVAASPRYSMPSSHGMASMASQCV